MVNGFCRLDSAVERLKSSSRRVVDLRGEARELGREGFAAGRRGTAGATSSARPARLVVHASSKEEERTALDGKLRGIHERRRAASGRDCRRVEAARRRPQSPVWPASYIVSSTGDPLFLRLNDFDSKLTS